MTQGNWNTLNPADIVEVAVYPPLGIARVGNAPGELDYVTAAEVIGGTPADAGALRDAQGAIKRQAVRFRIYAKLTSGQVRELTLDDDIEIQWRVAVANLKAGWYEFTNEINLPDGLPIPASKRNAVGPLPLGHHAAAAEIECRGVSGPEYVFEGHFFLVAVRFHAHRYIRRQREQRLDSAVGL